MAGHPLRSATNRRLGGPLPHQLANWTRVHPVPPEFLPLHHAVLWSYAVLTVVSNCYPPVQGRLPTRYSPVRHSEYRFHPKTSSVFLVRLACVKHAASVHPEPGSNSQIKGSFQVRITTDFSVIIFTRITVCTFVHFETFLSKLVSFAHSLCVGPHMRFAPVCQPFPSAGKPAS